VSLRIRSTRHETSRTTTFVASRACLRVCPEPWHSGHRETSDGLVLRVSHDAVVPVAGVTLRSRRHVEPGDSTNHLTGSRAHSGFSPSARRSSLAALSLPVLSRQSEEGSRRDRDSSLPSSNFPDKANTCRDSDKRPVVDIATTPVPILETGVGNR
jgi:hypothetical protein